MNIENTVNRLKEIKASIKELYKEKEQLERDIITVLNDFNLPLIEQNIELDGLVEIAILFEKRLNEYDLATKYPTVYKSGLKNYFSWKQALMSFDNPNDLWSVLKECTEYKKKHKMTYK